MISGPSKRSMGKSNIHYDDWMLFRKVRLLDGDGLDLSFKLMIIVHKKIGIANKTKTGQKFIQLSILPNFIPLGLSFIIPFVIGIWPFKRVCWWRIRCSSEYRPKKTEKKTNKLTCVVEDSGIQSEWKRPWKEPSWG